MNRNTFIDLFVELREDSIGTDPNSTTNLDDAYDTYIDLTKQIKSGDDFAITQMNRMSEMSRKERLKWRMCLSENGIEMTPRQVDEYIVLLEIALSFTE
tara:strand:+ start:1451 stop:1747 length:297 start_codon:yes stop_codon:yes gene_type:complete